MAKKEQPAPEPKKKGLLRKAWDASTDAAANKGSKTFADKHPGGRGRTQAQSRNRPDNMCFCGRSLRSGKEHCGRTACVKAWGADNLR